MTSSTATEPCLRIGAIAVEPARCDVEGNFALAERLITDCAAEGAQLVMLPEGFLEGYVVNEPGMTRERLLALAEPLDGPHIVRFQELARRLGIWLLPCFAERAADLIYNAALLIDATGRSVGRYRKTHAQSGGDWRFYTPGEALPVFQTPWGPLGVMICYDRQFPEVPRTLMQQGARLILNPSWGMFGEMNETMMRTRAYENGVFIVFAHVKGTLVLDPRGSVAARSAPDASWLVHDIDLREVDALHQRPRRHLTDHLRPDLYQEALRAHGRNRASGE